MIGLDARMISHTGIGTYIRGLIQGWQKLKTFSSREITLFGNEKEHHKLAKDFHWASFEAPIYSLQEQLQYPEKVSACRLWHAPHYNIPLFKGKTKLVVTVHDLIHWIYRGQFFNRLQAGYAHWMFNQVVKKADHMITVSEHTKQDLVEHFRADAARVSVIYEAVDESFYLEKTESEKTRVCSKYHLPEKYFLYVGSLKPHKNVLWLIRLYRKLFKERCVSVPLVLIGKKDKTYPQGFKELAELKDGEGIIYRSFVENGDLPSLYRKARALAHPSLYEGFGLTLLEAMASGIPVIANRAASIPEVAGNAAVLLPSNDAEAWKKALKEMDGNDTLRAGLREKGYLRVKQFDWEKTASQTAEIYKRVLA